jgi:hypothetical protein
MALTRVSCRLSSRSSGEGGGPKACDPSISSGQAEARFEEVYPERPFAKGRRSVTQETPSYQPIQQIVGEKRGFKRVISASRRQDMVGTDPDRLADILASSHPPERTHTVVVWTKNPVRLLNHQSLRRQLGEYDQIFVHLTITGMGGTLLEPRVPAWDSACRSIPEVVALTGDPRRVRLRFDPIVHLRLPDGTPYTNLPFFGGIASQARHAGVTDVTVSWMALYRKVSRRLDSANIAPIRVDQVTWAREARYLTDIAKRLGIRLHGCCVPGWERSACIDGRLLTHLHPRQERCSIARAKGQRALCGCTDSLDIGWYVPCAHGCLYCYAEPDAVPLSGLPLPSAVEAPQTASDALGHDEAPAPDCWNAEQECERIDAARTAHTRAPLVSGE